MNFIHLLFDPAILIVLLVFFGIMFYSISKYLFVGKNLNGLVNLINNFKKSDLVFRFSELNDLMSSNSFVSIHWAEFRNTLVFSESVSLSDSDKNVTFENISKSVSGIQTTVDPIYFFNEETLVNSKFNAKFVQAAPTLLTGLGPLFTFLNIAIAFSRVDFSTQETIINSISGLMSSMQVAAMCSVLAVGASLLFLLFEKILYNVQCKTPLAKLQNQMFELFENISSEKFLVELLKETKLQNNSISNLMTALPAQFKDSFDKSLALTLVPYLENLIFGVNKLRSAIISDMEDRKKNSDIVDNLF